MKTVSLLRTALKCGLLAFLLGSPRLGHAQTFGYGYTPIDPVIGPEVRIISPANHAVFHTPVDVPIFAYVVKPATGVVTNVSFYAGLTKLGNGFDLGSSVYAPPRVYANFMIPTPILRLSSVYCFVWTNAPAGNYSLTAVVKSGFSVEPALSRTSPPVSISILTPPTNSNPVDVVSIVATDPISIAGTNSWIWTGVTNTTPVWTNWPPTHGQSFTNWGPKNGLFTVRRFGPAQAAITVNYSIGGTASNGVDYASLPGSVTIPAGGAYALIPIVPIDNGNTNLNKTVILTLSPATNTPNYVIGIPPKASVLIRHGWPRPLPYLLPEYGFHVNMAGPDGAWYYLQTSPDLIHWTSVCTNQVIHGSIDYVDPNISGTNKIFYRAVPLNTAPVQ